MRLPTAHHIYKITELAARLDRQGRHADADRLDRIVRQAQWWNPIRTLKNWQNANEVNANQGDPADILRLMQLNLDKLSRNSQEQGWFVGLDSSIRPTVVRLVRECAEMLRDYAASFNSTPSLAPTSARFPRPVRLADLAGGLDRDITDVLGLLSNLTDTQTFPHGDALYAAIQARLKAVDDLLLGNITPQQAASQVGAVGGGSPSTATGQTPTTYVSQTGQQPQSSPWSAGGQTYSPGQNGAYTYPGETYNSVQYLQQERVPGSREWANEVQNYLAWGLKNGGLQALLGKMQQDRHTTQFQQAVQQAWGAKGLPSASTMAQNTASLVSTSAPSAQTRLMN